MQMPVAPAIMSSRERTVRGMFPGPSLGKLTAAITNAIHQSFVDDRATPGLIAVPAPTMAEMRRRFGICMDWACTLRGDLKWGVERIADNIPVILKTTLNGGKWSPSNRQCWIPSEGR